MGVTLSGSGLGHFLHPFIATSLTETFGWRGALAITGAVALNTIVCGLLTSNKRVHSQYNTQSPGEKTKAAPVSYATNVNYFNKKPAVDDTISHERTFQSLQSTGMNGSLIMERIVLRRSLENLRLQTCQMDDFLGRSCPSLGSHGTENLWKYPLKNRNTPLPVDGQPCTAYVTTSVVDLVLPKSQDCFAANEHESAHISRCCELQRLRPVPNWPRYVGLFISVALYTFSQSLVITHVVAFAINNGHGHYFASTLTAAIGFSSIIGRVVLGLLAKVAWLDATVVYITCQLVSALTCFTYAVATQYSTMLASLCVFGFSLSSFASLLNEVCITCVGLDNFSYSYGILMWAMAIGSLSGAPCAGWLYDVTGIYRSSFIQSSSLGLRLWQTLQFCRRRLWYFDDAGIVC